MTALAFEVKVGGTALAAFVHKLDAGLFAEDWSRRNHSVAELWDGFNMVGLWVFGVRQ